MTMPYPKHAVASDYITFSTHNITQTFLYLFISFLVTLGDQSWVMNGASMDNGDKGKLVF